MCIALVLAEVELHQESLVQDLLRQLVQAVVVVRVLLENYILIKEVIQSLLVRVEMGLREAEVGDMVELEVIHLLIILLPHMVEGVVLVMGGGTKAEVVLQARFPLLMPL
nr:MAG TPA: hypothetical protein [Caudoviricetes sp.]